MIDQKQIKKISDQIIKEFKPEKIIIFGSHAWGNPNHESDLDLFIIKKTVDPRNLARKIDKLLSSRDFALDLIVDHPSHVKERLLLGDPFLKKIFTKGKVIHEIS